MMKSINGIVKYILYMLLIVAMLLIFNFTVLAAVAFSGDDVSRTGVPLSRITGELSFDGQSVSLSDEGRQQIDNLNAFGLLLSEDGGVILDYNAPEDIPDSFSLCDVASFSRWYLNDYPVYSRILNNTGSFGNCLFALGLPKNSVWKYNLVYDISAINTYRKFFPAVILINLFIILVLPFFLTRRSGRKRELERTEWIAGVSHDIRTPLSIAILNTGKIIDNGADADDVASARLVLEQEMRLKSLVENLNADNKLRYGYGKRLREEVNLSAAVREIVCTFANSNERYTFECEIDEEAENFAIRADAGMLRRMLENIIGNSIRHNPEGCTVTVSLKPRNDRLRQCTLTIRDNGVGVNDEKLKTLNDSSEKPVIAEHGLGLMVVRRITRAYRWKLRYDSVENDYFECRMNLRFFIERRK